MSTQTIQVEGMTCGHCVETVNKAVTAVAGVRKVSVSLENKSVTVDYDETRTDPEAIAAKITEAGFEVKGN